MYNLRCLFFVFLLIGCVSSIARRDHLKKEFLEFYSLNREQIWAASAKEKVKAAVVDFQNKRKLSNGMIYGNSVRKLKLTKSTLEEIENEMSSNACLKKTDTIQDPKTGKPKLDSHQKQVPMDTYICPDGGVVRIKKQGDPMSAFRPQPHAIKALRYPFNSPYESFQHETVKVDDEGNPVPKWVPDLNREILPPSREKDLIEGWAEDVHTDLRD